MISDRKLVICNNHWEFYQFGKAMFYGSKRSISNRTPGPKENKLENRQLSFLRSKRNIRRLVNTNAVNYLGPDGKPCTTKFVTLTFKKNLQKIKKTNYIFKKFLQRFSYALYAKSNELKYIAVIEFQKRGAIHYHVIFFNIPFIPGARVAKIWEQGNIHVRKIKNIQDLGSYVCKYMTKNSDDPRLCGEKAYFTSRNLEKPKIIADWKHLLILEDFFPKESKVYETTFDSQYCGKSKYTLYNLKDYQKIKRNALAFLKL